MNKVVLSAHGVPYAWIKKYLKLRTPAGRISRLGCRLMFRSTIKEPWTCGCGRRPDLDTQRRNAVPPEGPDLDTPHDKAFTPEALDIPKLRDPLHHKAFATEALIHQNDLDQKSFASPEGFHT